VKSANSTEETFWLSPEYKKGLVSVIIPLYNRAHLIKETIDSVINQSYRPIECIVVDDGSTDQSRLVVEEYISKYSGDVSFKYYYQDNKGAQAARNFGSRKACGAYFQYLDSDDILFPEKISLQIAKLKDYPSFDGAFSNWCEGTKKKNSLVEKYKNDVIDLVGYFKTKPFIPFSMLLHRNAIITIGEWNELLTINEEFDYQIRFLLSGFKFKYVEINSGLWRVHNGFKLSDTNSFKNLHYYNCNIIKTIKDAGHWREEIGINIANNILWAVLRRNYEFSNFKVTLLLLARKYDKNLLPFQSKKVKIISLIFGKRIALKFWLLTLRYI